MGGSESHTQNEQLYNPDDFTIWKSQYNDIRYGKVNILKDNRTGMLVCEMDRTITTEEEFQQKVNHAEGRSQLQHPSLVTFLKYSTKKNEEFCSTFYKVSFLYEYIKIDLKEQIILRSWNNTLKPFQESELWYILRAAVDGLSYLKAKDIIHGDIRPSQIFLTDYGQVKLGEQFQQQSSLSGYQQLLTEQRREEFFVSPNVYESLRNKGEVYQYDQAANDVFALGLTLLEAALLKQTDLIYGEDYTFKDDVLHQYLHELEGAYSQKFYDIVSSMLIESEQDRPTIEEIQHQLEDLERDEQFRRHHADGVQLYLLAENDEIIQNPDQAYLQPQHHEEEFIEEHKKQANHGIKLMQESPQQIQKVEVIHPAVSAYDLQQIEDRINKVLLQSKHTVQQYGGVRGNQVYESYKPEQIPETIRSSRIANSPQIHEIRKQQPLLHQDHDANNTHTVVHQSQVHESRIGVSNNPRESQHVVTYSQYPTTTQYYTTTQGGVYNQNVKTTYQKHDDDYIPLPASIKNRQEIIKTSDQKNEQQLPNIISQQVTTQFQQQQQQDDLDQQIQRSLARSRQLEENIRQSQLRNQNNIPVSQY